MTSNVTQTGMEYTRGADDARGKKTADKEPQSVKFAHEPGCTLEQVCFVVDGKTYFPVDFDSGVRRLEDYLKRGYTIHYDPRYDGCHATYLYKSAAYEAMNKVTGAKFDADKVDMQLVIGGFPEALYAISEVATFGAKRYTRDGWKSVEDAHHRYSSALQRHINAHNRGEAIDPDSGRPHLAHAAWNAIAILQLEIIRNTQDINSCATLQEKHKASWSQYASVNRTAIKLSD